MKEYTEEIRKAAKKHLILSIVYSLLIVCIGAYTTNSVINTKGKSEISVGNTIINMQSILNEYEKIKKDIKAMLKEVGTDINEEKLKNITDAALPIHLKIQTEIDIGDIEAKTTTSDEIIKTFIAALARIGIVFIPLYLIYILFSLVRYHVRISSFYKGMALSIDLADNEISNVERYIQLFQIPKIDFDKTNYSNKGIVPQKDMPKIIEMFSSKIDTIISKLSEK